MTNDEIKADIISACEDAMARGFVLMAELFFKPGTCGGCAMTAVAFVHDGFAPRRCETRPVFDFAYARYGWSYRQVWNFARGFDRYEGEKGESASEKSYIGTPEYVIGQTVRAAVLP